MLCVCVKGPRLGQGYVGQDRVTFMCDFVLGIKTLKVVNLTEAVD